MAKQPTVFQRLLAAQRSEWERARDAGQDRGARLACRTALHLCQRDRKPLPTWLHDAIAEYVAPVTDDELRESDSNRNAIRRLNILWSVMAGAKKPNEQHYRDAAKQLNASGDPITPAAVKKLWQREGEIYLHMRKWQGRS